MRVNVPIGKVCARAFTIPTDKPEADGTIAWSSTTLVVVEINGGDRVGLGYTYSGAAIAELIEFEAGGHHHRSRRIEPGGGVARDAARGAQSRP